ncbi:hypothetical protein H2200_008605 [Cladophialophora chaetospira]|uniref:BPL/LPL catalytic domain-containing protein n=1 Tax=Cladophialophora chaetospira TaxID=386627 RepID=A0AA38X4D0_9EURO|nr:hypothetical protein H2200_008605 [Cladophialophora chaetospira]
MRLAHLHVPSLISYSHSLRLQNTILERYFQYKDGLRSQGGGNGSAATQNEEVRGGVSSHIHASGEEKQESGGSHSRLYDANSSKTELYHNAAGTTLHQAVTHKSHDQPRISLLRSESGGTPTPPTGLPNQGSSLSCPQHDHTAPPDPVLLTFSTPPTYTVGRRHLQTNPISPEQQAFLSANGLATFHASPRGGLLTYHAPGQLTGYVIADLRRHGITARCWVKLLEESVMRTCGAWGVKTGRTNDPGVWVFDSGKASGQTAMQDDVRDLDAIRNPKASDRKICAIGVQVSRGITSHGVGLNVYDAPLPTSPAQDPSKTGPFTYTSSQLSSPSYDPSTQGHLSWGFSRIVACGLEGKSVTWITRELARSRSSVSPLSGSPAEFEEHSTLSMQQILQPTEEDVANVLAREIMHGLNTMRGPAKETVDDIYRIQEADILT